MLKQRGEEWLRRLHKKTRIDQQQIKRLQEALADATGTDGMDLDEELHNDLIQLIKDHSKDVESTFDEGTFQRLFWSQQQTANSLQNSKSMRWHLLIIKWCLYLRHLLGKAYELLRSSGCIKLPSQRTLRDYTHYIKSQMGFCNEVDKAIMILVSPIINILF